jgi:hypothetical protein
MGQLTVLHDASFDCIGTDDYLDLNAHPLSDIVRRVGHLTRFAPDQTGHQRPNLLGGLGMVEVDLSRANRVRSRCKRVISLILISVDTPYHGMPVLITNALPSDICDCPPTIDPPGTSSAL